MEKITLIFARGRLCSSLQILLLLQFLLSGLISRKLCLNTFVCFKVQWTKSSETDQNKAICQLIKQWEEYIPAAFFNVSNDQLCYDLHPDCIYLLKLSFMFSLSIACVEELFSKIKLIKTCIYTTSARAVASW